MVKIKLITCPTWGAKPPKQPIEFVGKSQRIIIHHTAGHHREIVDPSRESTAESMQYARDIQYYHMNSNGWNDSGHNFLVCRNGDILQGRWFTVSAIQRGKMVRSAHCPGQNDQIGIEHEHQGMEEMTDEQMQSSATLIAWISDKYGLYDPLPLHPHKEYFNTSCPANLIDDIPKLFRMARQILKTSV